jgi:hypothetical protein
MPVPLATGFSPDAIQASMFEQPFPEFDKVSVQTSTSSSPAQTLPLPPAPVPSRSSNASANSLQAYLGISLSETRKLTYRDAYFKNFHSLFPVLHRQTFREQMQYPEQFLLDAAVMAIGAQYADEVSFASSDSKILHEKCQELINENKTAFCTSPRLEVMQAVVLVEFLSHFKAKRAPESLSAVFKAIYDKVRGLTPS